MVENSHGCETINRGRREQEESGGNHSKRRKAKRNSQDLIALPKVYMLKEENRKYLMETKYGRKRKSREKYKKELS